MRILWIAVILTVSIAATGTLASAGEKDILKEGIVGAGSGAVASWASGAKGKNVWKGALAGAGVNVVGGALLDSLSGEHVESVDNVKSLPAEDAYSQGYREGFNNGYKQGYTEGYRDAVREARGQ